RAARRGQAAPPPRAAGPVAPRPTYVGQRACTTARARSTATPPTSFSRRCCFSLWRRRILPIWSGSTARLSTRGILPVLVRVRVAWARGSRVSGEDVRIQRIQVQVLADVGDLLATERADRMTAIKTSPRRRYDVAAALRAPIQRLLVLHGYRPARAAALCSQISTGRTYRRIMSALLCPV